MLIDQFLPEYDFNELYKIVIPSDSEKADQAFKNLNAEKVLIFNFLMGIRTLPNRLLGKAAFQLNIKRNNWWKNK